MFLVLLERLALGASICDDLFIVRVLGQIRCGSRATIFYELESRDKELLAQESGSERDAAS
jgi:hypothetical protein